MLRILEKLMRLKPIGVAMGALTQVRVLAGTISLAIWYDD